ncbi:MAG TPA: hypothetical protein VH437_22395 [Terriglobales bacterium]|jgi:hypothetical protein
MRVLLQENGISTRAAKTVIYGQEYKRITDRGKYQQFEYLLVNLATLNLGNLPFKYNLVSL